MFKTGRKQREFVLRRQEILQAAQHLFARNGFSKVSMQDIARASEFSVGSLYNFFNNKNELYQCLIAETALRIRDQLLTALSQGENEVQQLKNYLQGVVNMLEDNLEAIQLYLQEISLLAPGIRFSLNETLKSCYNDLILKLSQVIAQGQKKDVLNRAVDSRTMALALDGMITGLLVYRLERGEGEMFKVDVEDILKVFFLPVLTKDDLLSA